MIFRRPNPIPKTLVCPHCGTQMNLTGRGRAAGSVVYFCRRCVPMLQVKELWLGQVVRTGNLGFGFVQLRGPHGLGGLRFELHDCLDPASGRPAAALHIGNPVLVLLSEDASRAKQLWTLPEARSAQPATDHPSEGLRRRGVVTALKSPECRCPERHNDALHSRRRGVVTVLKSPEWGFLVDEANGISYFVHQADVCGGQPLAVGQRVTFLPAQTPRGRKACEVRIQSS